MGKFWDNATKEFGKKTGKALGNKLYGKHADDVRKRITWSNESRTAKPVIDHESIERAKRSTLEYEHDTKLLDTIIAIEFNTKDVDGIIKNLTFLSSSVDSWLTISDKKKQTMAARSQFKTGLAVLAVVNPEHPMLPYFSTKEHEWQKIIRKEKRQFIIGVIIFIVSPFALIALMCILGSILD